jgi:predicted nucleic acid-binding protein
MKERKLLLYLDTSVIGGYYDDEFSADTQQLFRDIKAGKYDIVISDLTLKELLRAPQRVKTLLQTLSINFKDITATDECAELAGKYLTENVVGQTSMDDCIHIATATIYKVDVLVSWNFKHIVNVQRIRGYNAVNMKNGYAILDIRSPKNLISYDEDEKI